MKELRGMPVVNSLLEKFATEIEELKNSKIVPKLAVIRVGAREDDLAYERGIKKRFAAVEACAETIELPVDVTQEELEATIQRMNRDEMVHGIMIFRPLPKHLSEGRIKDLIDERKDVDCMSSANNAHVFVGDKRGYPPCTPQAVMELLDYYGIELQGKKVVVVGRSMVVGRPLAMLLLSKNATVTICHTKTANLQEECKNADIILACAGVAKMINENYVSQNQVIIDVGINMDGDKLCGDVDFDQVCEKVEAITPVPGGIGTVTTSVLLKHTILSAKCEKIY
ncbi:MAG: bifunctional 5,10-methylenetetrahydrofolate dehydrogenase/5,10-methenyltetrahydrofolate cyclohydrolase [Lachnospiraceae bacterium]|nr:bifunctional 5,10-methylenetetrahydrofolate dehydrogenase/5,10-methenyltetrahydrofolate cyclohydrolase [Lachnospiraceae bacterium]